MPFHLPNSLEVEAANPDRDRSLRCPTSLSSTSSYPSDENNPPALEKRLLKSNPSSRNSDIMYPTPKTLNSHSVSAIGSPNPRRPIFGQSAFGQSPKKQPISGNHNPAAPYRILPNLCSPPASITSPHAFTEASHTQPFMGPQNAPFAKYYRCLQADVKTHNPGLSELQVADSIKDSWAKLPSCDREHFCTAAETDSAGSADLQGIKTAIQPISLVTDPNHISAHQEVSDNEIKSEHGFDDNLSEVENSNTMIDAEQSQTKTFQLQSFISDASLEVLESSVAKGVQFLEDLKRPLLSQHEGSLDATQWIQQIEKLQKQAVKSKTIIGMVFKTF